MTRADRVKWDERYLSGAYGDRTHPSAVLEQWIGRIPPGRALDVACGAGRNALYLAAHGSTADAVDNSGERWPSRAPMPNGPACASTGSNTIWTSRWR